MVHSEDHEAANKQGSVGNQPPLVYPNGYDDPTGTLLSYLTYYFARRTVQAAHLCVGALTTYECHVRLQVRGLQVRGAHKDTHVGSCIIRPVTKWHYCFYRII